MKALRFALPMVGALALGAALGTASLAFADTGTSTPATASSTPLTINNVRVATAATHATVRWHTNMPADSKIQYGTTTSYGMTDSDNSNVSDHALVLQNLATSTTYHFKVISTAGADRATSKDGTFTTDAGATGGGGGGGTGTTTLAAPTLLAPANGASLDDSAAGSVSWNPVTDSAGGITYTYQSSLASSTTGDGTFSDPAYTSGALSTTSLSIAGTPDGTYYWHVRAADSTSNQSDWSSTWSFTVASSSSGGGGGTGTTTAPMISNIAVGSTGTSTATITWTTDQPASSQIFYGADSSYGASTTLDTNNVTSHSVMVSGLSAGNTYHFMVQSANANGSANGSDMTFTTESGNSAVALALLGIDTVRGTASADGAFADGFEWIFHFVVPTDETQFAMSFSDFWNTANASNTIPAAGDIQYYSAQSDTASSSNSAVMINAANQYPSTMLDLNGDASSTSDGRQVDVVVQMKVPSGTTPGDYLGDWNAESNPATSTATTTP